mgnify:CR=1 FL=1
MKLSEISVIAFKTLQIEAKWPQTHTQETKRIKLYLPSNPLQKFCQNKVIIGDAVVIVRLFRLDLYKLGKRELHSQMTPTNISTRRPF